MAQPPASSGPPNKRNGPPPNKGNGPPAKKDDPEDDRDAETKARARARAGKFEERDEALEDQVKDPKFRKMWELGYEFVKATGHDNQMTTPTDPNWDQYANSYSNPNRPTRNRQILWNNSGKEALVDVNFHEIRHTAPTLKVPQYDIIISGGTGHEKRGLMRALWESKVVRAELGQQWIWNGDKIAWSDGGIPHLTAQGVPFDQQNHIIRVDLDDERMRGDKKTQQGAQEARARGGFRGHKDGDEKIRDNKFQIQIRYAATVDLHAIWNYLQSKCDYDTKITEAVTLFNHIIRTTPSSVLNVIKNSFFPKNLTSNNRYDVGGGVYALRGAFQSVRMTQGGVQVGSSTAIPAGRLMMNVDVANACFYQPFRVDHVAHLLLGVSQAPQFISMIGKVQPGGENMPYRDTVALAKLKVYLRRLAFKVDYPGASEHTKSRRFIIKDISYDTSLSRHIEIKDKDGKVIARPSIQEYFYKQYKFRLEYPTFPLVEATAKGVFYPMELCVIEDGQRYPYKLDERQTSDMIKFAVSRPAKRMEAIQTGLKHLNWKDDKILKHFGIEVNPNMFTTKARVLSPPRVVFADNKAEDPKFSGRWRVDGKKFFRTGKPLTYWGVCVISDIRGRATVSKQEVITFFSRFTQVYKNHGGTIRTTSPVMVQASESDTANAVDVLMTEMRNKGMPKEQYPDLLVFVLPRKNTESYQRLKRCADLKFGSMSQCVQGAQVKKCDDQYISNVLMKVNAKLGGQSFKAVPVDGPAKARGGSFFTKPTMIIGADVSHPGPGSLGSSMCAMTVSVDREAIRYGARVQSNGHRLEMITTWNWFDMLGPMLRYWMSVIGGGQLPKHVYYFRDGVSEGQYEHVIQQEVRDIRAVFKSVAPPNYDLNEVRFTVVVASKRHHIRFFPRDGPAKDRNGNPVPGVLVEKDVTSVKNFDFYLNSHSAIQGTARPTHYTVILDQTNMEPTELENMVYAHCYQYIRSSTPVSLYPAIYYAHLASRRAVAHERTGQEFKPHRSFEQRERYMLMRARAEADMTGKIMTEEAMAKLKKYTTEEYPPVIPTCNPGLWNGMWYI